MTLSGCSRFITMSRTRTDIPDSYRDVNTMVFETKKFGACKRSVSGSVKKKSEFVFSLSLSHWDLHQDLIAKVIIAGKLEIL